MSFYNIEHTTFYVHRKLHFSSQKVCMYLNLKYMLVCQKITSSWKKKCSRNYYLCRWHIFLKLGIFKSQRAQNIYGNVTSCSHYYDVFFVCSINLLSMALNTAWLNSNCSSLSTLKQSKYTYFPSGRAHHAYAQRGISYIK